ncbi:MAG: glycosyltransferase family 2 protein, partial [Bdellovibrio sp.]|nr:glycosyltransferase family 2 protein [Bdellovibrio sp.]
MKISVIIPCYGAPNAIVELHDQLKTVLSTLTEQYEIILVNDNCPKGSWEKIIEVANKDSNVKGINLSRNFGQHAAISCGIEHVTGEWAVVMDCDLQDCPSYIVRLFEKAQSGYEVVVARRVYRNESFFKKCLSWMFYKFLKMVLDVHMDHQVGNFGIYSKQVLSSIHAMGDRVRFFPYLVSWVGFRHTTVDVEQNLRTDGKSSYS